MDYWKRLQTDIGTMPEKAQKSFCRKIKQVLQEKKSESVNIEFSLRRKQIRKNRKTEFPTF